jgi:hypothetical protein
MVDSGGGRRKTDLRSAKKIEKNQSKIGKKRLMRVADQVISKQARVVQPLTEIMEIDLPRGDTACYKSDRQ